MKLNNQLANKFGSLTKTILLPAIILLPIVGYAKNPQPNEAVAQPIESQDTETYQDSTNSQKNQNGQSNLQTAQNNQANTQNKSSNKSDNNKTSTATYQPSYHFSNPNRITRTLNKVLPSFRYSTDNLSAQAQKVNQATWKQGAPINRQLGSKIQALLNWNHHGVGAVDGHWGKNTRKAMQAFQQSQGLPVTDTMNSATWQALTADSSLANQPVLVNYQLTDKDVNIKLAQIPEDSIEKSKLEGLYYQSLTEALAEKFHMDEAYFKALNKNSNFAVGDVITVYNFGTPNRQAISRVVADKTKQTLYAYGKDDKLLASYPTTVGSSETPSPSGTHQVKVKVYQPNYTYTHTDGKRYILPPGANSPVGLVWIGLTKPTYGIHGSPYPERISRQASSGCVRLTNWDALALYAVIDNNATVEFE